MEHIFYHYDIRGSVSAIVDPDGNPVKQYAYDEFGNLTTTGEATFDNEVTFTGSITDSSTGLQYMNSRYYEPTTGRFLTQDTYSGNAYEPWTQHLYTYCGNNPTNFVDPTGHRPIMGDDPYDEIWTKKNGEWVYKGSRKEQRAAEEAERIGGYSNPDGRLTEEQTAANATVIYNYLNIKGWSDDAIFAALGNFKYETKGTLDPGMQQSNGSGYGLAQWTGDGPNGNAYKVKKYLEENGYAQDSIQGQLEFLMDSMQPGGGQWTRANPPNNNYYLSPEHFISGELSYADDPSLFAGLSNVQALTQIFYHSYERSSGGWNEARYWD